MRVLLYGGCHAAAIKRIVERHGSRNDHVELLVNFAMIAHGQPFPYDDLDRFDCVVFNPIRRKDEWNTARLDDELEQRRIPSVKYPWITWLGYFPGAVKTDFGWHAEWWSQPLVDLAREHETFETFYDEVVHGEALADLALTAVEESTAELRRREVSEQVNLPLAEHIHAHFRERRLFQSPDTRARRSTST